MWFKASWKIVLITKIKKLKIENIVTNFFLYKYYWDPILKLFLVKKVTIGPRPTVLITNEYDKPKFSRTKPSHSL